LDAVKLRNTLTFVDGSEFYVLLIGRKKRKRGKDREDKVEKGGK